MTVSLKMPAGEQPMFSARQLRVLLLPLLAEQFLAVTMGVADTAMVASLGEAAVSGVNLVDTLNVTVLQVVAALATGGAVVTSQYLGRKDEKNAARSAAQLYLVVCGSLLAASAVMLLFRRQILAGLFGQVEPQVMEYAHTYFWVSALSYPFMGLYNAGAAIFRAQGNSKINMRTSFVMNLVNVAGNALLIFVFRLGVLGAALATLTGRVLAAVWVTAQMLGRSGMPQVLRPAALRPDKEMIGRILRLGIPTGIENGMFQVGKLLVIRVVGTLGTAAIAANAVCNTVSTLANIPGLAVGMGMIPVVGQCLGAGKKQQAGTYAARMMLLAYAGVASINAVLLAAAPTVVGLFNLSAPAQQLTVQVLVLFNLVSMVVWPSSFVLPSALHAGGDAKFTMAISMTSMWLFRVGFCYLFVLGFRLGLFGVWYAMFVDWTFRAVVYVLRLRSGRWIQKVI